MKRIVFFICFAALAFSASAQMVGATNRQSGGRMTTFDNQQAQHQLVIELGQPTSVAYNYRLTPYIAVGGGLGTVLWGFGLTRPVPAFVDVRFSLPYNTSWFLDIKGIYNINYSIYGNGTPLGFSATVGYTYKKLSIGAGILFLDEGEDYYSSSYYSSGGGATDLITPAITIGWTIPMRQ